EMAPEVVARGPEVHDACLPEQDPRAGRNREGHDVDLHGFAAGQREVGLLRRSTDDCVRRSCIALQALRAGVTLRTLPAGVTFRTLGTRGPLRAPRPARTDAVPAHRPLGLAALRR